MTPEEELILQVHYLFYFFRLKYLTGFMKLLICIIFSSGGLIVIVVIVVDRGTYMYWIAKCLFTSRAPVPTAPHIKKHSNHIVIM